jgi:hypothetical protein
VTTAALVIISAIVGFNIGLLTGAMLCIGKDEHE